MDFDQYRRRPCYRVHCLAQLCLRLTLTYELNATDDQWKSRTPFAQAYHSVRCLPAYRGIGGNTLRRELAGVLRQLRSAGLARYDVRHYAETIIFAPTSYADEEGQAIRKEIEDELRTLLIPETNEDRALDALIVLACKS
jgi:hypothetical protein